MWRNLSSIEDIFILINSHLVDETRRTDNSVSVSLRRGSQRSPGARGQEGGTPSLLRQMNAPRSQDKVPNDREGRIYPRPNG